MDIYKVSYGIISSADLSYFVWYDLHDVLHISRGVEWQEEQFVAVLSCFLQKVAKDTIVYAEKEGKWPAYDFLIMFVITFELYFVICFPNFF